MIRAISRFLPLICCCTCALARVAHSAEAASDLPELLEQLRAEDATQAGNAWAELSRQRAKVVDRLISIASSSESDIRSLDARHRAIELLGEYRAVEGVPALLARIEFTPPHLLASQDPLFRYPAARALLEIGERAVREILLAQTARDLSDFQLKLFAYVVWLYYAPQQEQEVGLYRIERALEEFQTRRRTSDDRKGTHSAPSRREQNLARLMEMYRKIKPNDPADWPCPPEMRRPRE